MEPIALEGRDGGNDEATGTKTGPEIGDEEEYRE